MKCGERLTPSTPGWLLECRGAFKVYYRRPLTYSDGARCLEVGKHENPDLPEAFHERRMHEFANLDELRDPYFQIVGYVSPQTLPWLRHCWRNCVQEGRAKLAPMTTETRLAREDRQSSWGWTSTVFNTLHITLQKGEQNSRIHTILLIASIVSFDRSVCLRLQQFSSLKFQL